MSKRWAQILPTTSRKFGSVFRDPTEPNNTEPKLRYSVNSVRFGRTLVAIINYYNFVALIFVTFNDLKTHITVQK